MRSEDEIKSMLNTLYQEYKTATKGKFDFYYPQIQAIQYVLGFDNFWEVKND